MKSFNPTMAKLLHVLLFVSIYATLVFADGIQVSIDCGSSDSYEDENSLSWIGDHDFIKNGESMAIDASENPSLPRAMTTLRVFTTRSKNCYSISAKKGEKVLVRASFYYGNYDGRFSAPRFNLFLEGNVWIGVVTSIDTVVFHEAIYVTKSDTINVCVAQATHGELPFISALEVRSLSLNMYNSVDQNYALIKRRRVAFGTTDIIRYPADAYDRIWLPASNPSGLLTVAKNTAQSINVSFLDDSPPVAVLKNAFIFPNTSIQMRLLTNLPAFEVPIYLNLYFSEVFLLNSTEERSFTFNVDDSLSSLPIIPPYKSVVEVTLSNYSASENTVFILKSTANSTLPVLVNALEIYSLSDALTDGTNSDDVRGLNILKDTFVVLKDWNGDPCLPSPYVWDWVNCSSDTTPRVTSLLLGSFNLTGELPDFSSMDALVTIDLHNNSLKGPIPDFLGNLPTLMLLNLSNNNFDGSLPASLSKNTRLKLDVSGNSKLIQPSPTPGNGNNSAEVPMSPPSGTRKKDYNLLITLAIFAALAFLL